MFIAALIAGISASILVWAVASHYLSLFIVASDQTALRGIIKKRSRAFEIVLCTSLFLVCVALAVLITS
ncbi:MAG: hypothetical protein ACREAC_14925, partial [Blastocatellia bacterium]